MACRANSHQGMPICTCHPVSGLLTLRSGCNQDVTCRHDLTNTSGSSFPLQPYSRPPFLEHSSHIYVNGPSNLYFFLSIYRCANRPHPMYEANSTTIKSKSTWLERWHCSNDVVPNDEMEMLKVAARSKSGQIPSPYTPARMPDQPYIFH